MPKYIEILPDGTRRTVKYRMKDSIVMRNIRLAQKGRKLSELEKQGKISPNDRKHEFSRYRRQIDEKFAPALARASQQPSPAKP